MQTPRPQPSEPAAPPGAAPRLRGAPLVVVGLLALPLAFVLVRCSVSNDVPFLVQSSSAAWIAAPEPVAGTLRQWGREDVPKSVFRRSFELSEKPAQAKLRVRALRAFRVSVNGAPAPDGSSDGSRWRDPLELDVAQLLTTGKNELAIEVENPIGPALLSLRLAGVEPAIVSDVEWRVSFDGGAPALAVLADDTRRSPESLAVETPAEAMRKCWVAVALLFAAGAAASLAFPRFAAPGLVQQLPAAALVAGCLAWVRLFARKLVHLPVTVGFDARSHLFYVDWLATKSSVPLATDGWSTFHPPLFYAIGAAVGGAGAESSEASALALKAVVFVAGLLGIAATGALARRLLPEDPAARALAILFAAMLPVNLYSSAYVTNESLHTLLVSLALLAGVDVLLAQRPQAARFILLGALFGLAALTKFTVLVLIPVVFLCVALKLWRVDGHSALGVALRLLLALAPLLAIAGWFYWRNWQVFGDPLMANWGGMPGAGHTWWQQPGFHTLAYFARFGEALVHPYMAGFTSFWDSTYSTFWGDGFIGGRVYAPERHGLWSYDFMSIGYWLALPASALVLFGAWRGVRLALGDRDAGRRAAFGLLAASAWVLGLAYLYLVLRLAFFGQAKATYLLPLLTPLALWFALGFRALDLRLTQIPLARAALHGWLAAFAVVLYLGFAG